MQTVLVTGSAGFIGFHFSTLLLEQGFKVIGLDNLNDYYDVKLKLDRLALLKQSEHFTFEKIDLKDRADLDRVFAEHSIDYVVNLAAQAGVRYSLENPASYIDANIVGFANILECCRYAKVKHLTYASSSSVYGANKNFPFSEHSTVDHPLALYGATKKANEVMSHSYASLFDLPCTGLRFFTVYGPWGRPDMALFKFTKAIIEGKPIDVYNHGDMSRDFTYVDDIVQGIYRVMLNPAQPNPDWNPEQPDTASSYCPWRVYNIGRGEPVRLLDFITALEKTIGKPAEKNMLPMQPGDVAETASDTTLLNDIIGYAPRVSVEQGIAAFVAWYKDYYKVTPSHYAKHESVSNVENG